MPSELERLDAIEKREKAATADVRLVMNAEEEAWRLVAPMQQTMGEDDKGDFEHIASIFDGNSANAGPNCVFYAHARADIPYLLALVRGLQSENLNLRALLESCDELRRALATAMDVCASNGCAEELVDRMEKGGVKDGIGTRAANAIAAAQQEGTTHAK